MNLVIQTTVLVTLLCLALQSTRKYNQFCAEYNEYGDPYTYSNFCILLLLMVLIVNEGFRHGYQDTVNYVGGYRDFSDDLSILLAGVEAKGFALFQWCLRKICAKPQFIIIVMAVIINVSDLHYIKKYAFSIPFSIYLWFLDSFISNMNGLRQILAAVILMLAFPLIVKKEYIKYIAVILLLSTIHKSILIVIPLAFLYSGKRWNVGIVLFELFCVVSVFSPGVINRLIGQLASDKYANYITNYTASANIMNALVMAVPLILGIIYHVNNKDSGDRVVDVLINMHAISFGFMMLATTMAQYARIGMYMRNASALITPFLISKVFGSSAKMVSSIAVVLYTIVFWVQIIGLKNWGALEVLYLDFSFFS